MDRLALVSNKKLAFVVAFFFHSRRAYFARWDFPDRVGRKKKITLGQNKNKNLTIQGAYYAMGIFNKGKRKDKRRK